MRTQIQRKLEPVTENWAENNGPRPLLIQGANETERIRKD